MKKGDKKILSEIGNDEMNNNVYKWDDYIHENIVLSMLKVGLLRI